MVVLLYLKTFSKRLWVVIALIITASATMLNGCNHSTAPLTGEKADIADGEILSKKYCASCHEWPSPSLLDKSDWINGVLPAMSKQLRVRMYIGEYFTDESSAINISDWQKIVTYYKKSAPVALAVPKPAVAPLSDWAIFSLQRPKKTDRTNLAMTTMVTFDTVNRKVYSGDAGNNLYEWDSHLHAKLVYHFESPVTGARYFKSADGSNISLITCIGNLPPVNLSKGTVSLINLDKKNSKPVLIADSLPRAVETVMADYNKDGLMDYVTCGFGHDRGGLYLLQQQQDHTFKRVVMSSIAGAQQLITGDFNNDGWPDVMCLFAQADEGIRMFLNDHKGGFTTRTLLRFPPVYGSTSFQLIDFNHDGKPDILYTCGDNSDFSKVLKPYHGIYIFTNQGNWKFEQTYFYHINGCTKAIAADFDHDGKPDIAAIAFFPDFKYHPREGFTYLQQTGPNRFTAHEIPINSYGRWLTMTTGDIDHDGRDDIILGNFSTGGRGLVNQPGFVPDWDMHEPIIVLKNNSGKKR